MKFEWKAGRLKRYFSFYTDDIPDYCACSVIRDMDYGVSRGNVEDRNWWECGVEEEVSSEDEAFLRVLLYTRSASGCIFIGDRAAGRSKPLIDWLAQFQSITVKDGQATITYTPVISDTYINGYHNSRCRHCTILVERKRTNGKKK
jgi:hypothetical protein